MSILRPIILVSQEFRTISQATPSPVLDCLVVGPCYNYLTYADDRNAIEAGTYEGVGANFTPVAFEYSADLPGHIAGSRVEGLEEDLRVFLDDAEVQIYGNADAPVTVDDNELTTTVSGAFEDVAIGDRVTVTAGGDTATGKVYAIDGDTLSLTTPLPTAAEISVQITRMVDHVEVDASHLTIALEDNGEFQSLTLDANTVIPAGDGNSYPVVTSKLYIAHRAIRTDLTNTRRLRNTTEIREALGKLHPKNPGALGAWVAKQNTITSIRFLGVPSNDAAGFSVGIDRIKADRSVYAIAALTTDTSITAAFRNHVEAYSDINQGKNKFRVAITGGEVPKLYVIATGSTGTLAEDGGVYTLEDTDAAFMTAGNVLNQARVGDLIHIGGATFAVTTIVHDQKLRMSLEDGSAPANGAVTYNHERSLVNDRTAQVEMLTAIPISMNSKRTVMCLADSVTIEPGNTEYTGLPAYYLAAVVAGMTASLPSQRGFTGIGIAGVKAVHGTNDYFDDDELQELSSAGWMVFEQEAPGALPHIAHQLTTAAATGILEDAEYSFVKNFDYVSIFLRDALTTFIRGWNITPDVFGFIEDELNNNLEFLVSQRLPQIGAPVISGAVEDVAESEFSNDEVDAVVGVDLPMVLNRIRLRIISG